MLVQLMYECVNLVSCMYACDNEFNISHFEYINIIIKAFKCALPTFVVKWLFQ